MTRTPSRPAPDLKGLLRSAGLKVTPARIGILQILQERACLMTIDEVSSALLGRGGSRKIDWTTVYRTLQSFEDAGIVARTQLSDGSSRFEYHQHGDGEDHHHHHVICKRCGRIESLEGCGISAIEEELHRQIEKRGFTQIAHRLEFSGLCKDCRGGKGKK